MPETERESKLWGSECTHEKVRKKKHAQQWGKVQEKEQEKVPERVKAC